MAPYPQPYYPGQYPQAQRYPVAWADQPATDQPASPQPMTRVSYTPPVAPDPSAQDGFAPETDTYAPQASNDTPSEPRNPRATFADETVDYGVPPTNTLHLHDFDAPTPTHIQGARTVTALGLQNMLTSDRPPLLVDVIGGQQSVSLPNAIWLRDAGVGRHLDDDVQAWFDYQLLKLTNRDKSHPLVFFCASRMCWLAHNATLRALDLGFTNVYWFRGGRDAWQAAGFPMAPITPPPS
jgi:PQQ-dependent catabolism-associated CXXCW motif protein